MIREKTKRNQKHGSLKSLRTRSTNFPSFSPNRERGCWLFGGKRSLDDSRVTRPGQFGSEQCKLRKPGAGGGFLPALIKPLPLPLVKEDHFLHRLDFLLVRLDHFLHSIKKDTLEQTQIKEKHPKNNYVPILRFSEEPVAFFLIWLI